MNDEQPAMSVRDLGVSGWIMVVLLSIGALLLLRARFTSEASTLRFLIDETMGSDRTADIVPFRDEDARWRAVAGGKPLALSFVGFSSLDPMDRFFVAQRYFRCVYAVFPAAVHVVPAGVIVNDARPLIDNPLNADDSWLRANGIGAHVIVEKAIDGSIDTRVHRAGAATP